MNQRRSDNEGQRRPGQNQFKREVPGGQNVRPGGQVARQLDRYTTFKVPSRLFVYQFEKVDAITAKNINTKLLREKSI